MAGPYVADCPFVVDRPAMLHRWDRLTFLHWCYPIGVVQELLPHGLVVDEFEGDAWVGLVPFYMVVRTRGGHGLPWLLEFPETNVRTYAVGLSGERGVWFFSLDASRLAAVVTARATYRVPYFWSQMSVERTGNTIRYRSMRRWPGPRKASTVDVDIGERYRPDELGGFDHYLTARWTLFGTWGGRLLSAKAFHPPWELHGGVATNWSDDLVAAVGLPQPSDDPVVHWSPGVDVRIGFPEFL